MIKKLTIILLLATGSYAAVPFPFTLHIPEVADSIVATHYYGTATYETVRASSTDSLAKTWQLQETRLNQMVYNIWYSGQDSASSFTYARDLHTSYGATENWRLFGARWSEGTDSAQFGKYEDGVQVGATSTRGSTVRSYDTTIYATAGKHNEARITLYYPAQSPATWVFAWDVTDTSTGTTLGSGVVATGTVTGRVFLKNGSPADGAILTATAGPAVNLATGTGTRYIFLGEPITAQTDSSGEFTMQLATTGSYADTTKGLYNIVCTYQNKEMFNIKDLWIGLGTLNLADSLAGRTR